MIKYTVKVFDDGTKHWLLNGDLHREDGPAVEYADGGKEWYLNGERHREDGPAIESKGVYINEQTSNNRIEIKDGSAFAYSVPASSPSGQAYDFSTDGVVYDSGSDGTKQWYLNGQLHREDGPAIEWLNGDKEWFLNGQLHRDDGPAVEYADGPEREWWLNGKEVTEQEVMNPSCSGKVVEIDGKKYKLEEL